MLIITNSAGWKDHYPWIIYFTKPEDILRTETIKWSFAFADKYADEGDVPILPLYIAKYDIKGNLIDKISPLTDELSLCPWSSQDTLNFKRFGNHFKKSCTVDITGLFYNNMDQFFYELYLENPLNKELIDIPVAITNYLTCKIGLI